MKPKTTSNKALDREIASQIYAQIGGGRFIAMTGAKTTIIEKGISFHIPTTLQKYCNRMDITLNVWDTYDVKFYKGTHRDILVDDYDNIYADQLRHLFEMKTKLCTSL